jgi:hypothetical protein
MKMTRFGPSRANCACIGTWEEKLQLYVVGRELGGMGEKLCVWGCRHAFGGKRSKNSRERPEKEVKV